MAPFSRVWIAAAVAAWAAAAAAGSSASSGVGDAEVAPDGSARLADSFESATWNEARRKSPAAAAARRKLQQWAATGDLGDVEDEAPQVQAHSHDHRHGKEQKAGHHQCIHDLIVNSMAAGEHHANRPSAQSYAAGAATAEPNHAEDGGGSNAKTSRAHGARRLAGASEFQRIRFHLDTSGLDSSASNPEKNSQDQVVGCYTVGQTYTPTIAKSSGETATCKESDILTPAKKAYLRDVILKEAADWFKDVLSVRPVSGNLQLPNPMFETSCYDSGWVWYSFKCCAGDQPASHATTGVPDADFVLYVTARPTSGNVLAWALTCQSDQYARPIAGHANFSPARISTDPADKATALSTAIHEISHALGFSASHFPLFRKPGTLQKVDRQSDAVATFTEFGKSTSKIVMPKTVAAVKEHFGCTTWPNAGAELEDGGSSGTAGSHLEKRLFANEFMTGTADPNSVYSAITMAIFEDSGWYAVSYDRAEKLPFGSKQGCDFVRKTCGEGWSNEYFCGRDQSFTGWQEGCTPDRRYRASCNLATNPFELLPQFQYFSDPKKGGTDLYSDYCPFFRRLGTGDCRSSSTIPYWYYGERTGSSSMCFTGNFQRSSLSRALSHHSACLQAGCSIFTNLLEVTLTQGASELKVSCPSSGGAVDLAAISDSQFTGTLDCPPSSSICTGDPCDVQTCNGHGRCNSEDGTCDCDTGFVGDTAYSCDKIECPGKVFNNGTGVTSYCSGHGTCNFAVGRCETPAGQPGCDDGWRQSSDALSNDCGEKGCPLSASTDCLPTSPGFTSGGMCECGGRGNCTQTTASGGEIASVCSCPKGWMGAACELRDCPGEPRCGGSSQGTCDTARGVCACSQGVTADVSNPLPVHYVGQACGTLVGAPRPFPVLGMFGELRNNATELTGATMDGGVTINIPSSNNATAPASPVPGAIEVTGVTPSDSGFGFYGAASVELPLREYRYVKFYVPSAEVSVTFVLDLDEVTSLDPSGIAVSLADAARSVVVTASYSNAASSPTAMTAQFNASLQATGNGGTKPSMLLLLQPSGVSGVGGFSEPGWIRVAILSARTALRGSMRVSRDACAEIECVEANVDTSINGGSCRDGRCPCRRSITGTYGWTGADCSVPDCPGSPDCGGKRGTCVLPTASSSSSSSSSGASSLLPSCQCTDPTLFSGADCNTLTLPSGTRTPGLDANGRYFVSPGGQFDSYQSNGTKVRAVITVTGRLDVGAQVPAIMLDPQALRECCGFDPSSTSVHVVLDAVSMPGRNAFNITDGPTSSYRPQTYATAAEGIPDPVLLTRAGAIPTLAAYDNFDSAAWASLRPVHETIDRLPTSDLFFIAVLNGRYATAPLSFTLQAELVGGGACPSFLNECSGHSVDPSNPCASGGTGSAQSICKCKNGWEGVRCDIAAPPVVSGDVVSARDIVPGSWRFFVHRVPESAVEVRLMASPADTHSSLAAPAVVVAWDSSRDSSRSLALLQGPSAVLDFDAFAARNSTQTLVVSRTKPSSQRYLYIGVHNAPRGKGSASITLSVDARRSPSLAEECPGGGCPGKCSNRGRVASVNGAPQCFCDFGWNPDTRCASPLFSSFAQLAQAAQQMGFLCSLCKDTVDLPRDGMAFFKAQRPLQRGTALQLDVGPPDSEADAAAAAARDGSAGVALATHVRRPMEGFSVELSEALAMEDAAGRDVVDVRDFEAGHAALTARAGTAAASSPRGLWAMLPLGAAPARTGRRLQAAAANTTLAGNPSLLVADALPRSILDFVVVRSSQRLNETVVVTDATTVSSSVWVTLYAQTEGRFSLGASRAQLSSTPIEQSDFFAEVVAWLTDTTTGQIVLYTCAGLLGLLCICCAVFGLCPGARSTLNNQAEIESAKAKRELTALFQSQRAMNAAVVSDADEEDEVPSTAVGKLRAASRRFMSGRAPASAARGRKESEDEAALGPGFAGVVSIASRRNLASKAKPTPPSLAPASAASAGGAAGADVGTLNPMMASKGSARLKPKSRAEASRRALARKRSGEADEAAAMAQQLRSMGAADPKSRSLKAAAKSVRQLGGRPASSHVLSVDEIMALPQVHVDRIPPPPRR
ncbi:hypothetical protein FNF27_04447 [Cafeteria roenbergensis]|uniref:EGF-like domain-containing protein n=1 Tax=Cafeteria roenbergensis TaxID=33653 RepID=A0A5A8EDQ8_CAFRO|nr:hypothetical protein FNF31_05959 [Cafeteria roenbergensis]KAA0174061.1 hypothetical protein FNF27_04447 [Cafeteria roenbergensis]